MYFFNKLLLGASKLPDPTEGFDWATDLIQQVVILAVIFVLTKFVFKLKIGQIIVALVIGGFVYYAITNTEKVFGWIEALLNTL